MGFPVWHGIQFGLFLHILKKRDHASQLLSHRSLYAALVIVLDKAPQPLMPTLRGAAIPLIVIMIVALISTKLPILLGRDVWIFRLTGDIKHRLLKHDARSVRR